ncbi:hypothetical protein CHISP_2798 [Chitinispirillum alkaliphilum]|nr:hypothetical protein CHISP_2798 [Chitinispirillum alkaliphilum]
MKHDLDLIHAILEHAQNQTRPSSTQNIGVLREKDSRTADDHISLLLEKKLINASKEIDCTGTRVIHGITEEGSEFLRAIKSDSVRKKVKDAEKEMGEKMTFEVVYGIAKDFLSGLLL